MRIALALLAALFAASVARAKTIVVAKSGPIATIQDGIDAAAAGDKVVIHAGLYRENALVPAPKTGLSIVGKGKVVIDARPAGGIGNGPGLRVLASGVRVARLTVMNAEDDLHPGDGIAIEAADCVVTDCVALACTQAGVGLYAAKAIVRRLRTEACGRGVNVAGPGCTVTQGSFRRGDAGVIVSEILCTVSKCSFERLGGTAVVVHGDDCVIEDNRFRDCGYRAIGLFFDCDRAVVRDNVVKNLALEGVWAVGSEPLITGNQFIGGNRDATGVYLDQTAAGGVVENNVALRLGRFGFQVANGGTGLVLRGNRAEDCGSDAGDPGFRLGAGTYTLTENVAKNCSGDGFRITEGVVTLEQNQAIGNLRDGFDVDAASVIGTQLIDNVAKGNLAEGIDNEGLSTLIGNVCKGNRIDLANSGIIDLFNSEGNVFETGGFTTAPEID